MKVLSHIVIVILAASIVRSCVYHLDPMSDSSQPDWQQRQEQYRRGH